MIVSGLTEEEKQAFNVDYREGEVLDRKAFGRLVELGEEMLEIYPKLCKGHREMVAKRYYEAHQRPHQHLGYRAAPVLPGGLCVQVVPFGGGDLSQLGSGLQMRGGLHQVQPLSVDEKADPGRIKRDTFRGICNRQKNDG